ncbi:hypothetical protein WJX81_003581 [Elliptochloris bilobata]|uniref:MEKHLA domain-containing protein n=1 Tax=Elliptochloris bilobata TaxID=381761 RepID=A0AAW1QIV1_9CHLO
MVRQALLGGAHLTVQRPRCRCRDPVASAWATPSGATQGRKALGVFAARKGGGKKAGGQKKGPGSLMGAPAKLPYQDTPVIMQNLLMVESYRRKVGGYILEDVELADAARALWEAPFAVLAHDKFLSPEPSFTYANKVALELFEATWEEIIGTPSRRSAEEEAPAQEERNGILEAAADKGYVSGITGWRRSLKGTRFQIRDGVLFNIEAPTGQKVGQAAVFRHWAFEDGREGGPDSGAAQVEAGPPSEAEIVAAEEGIAEQAALVRVLKEEHGLPNDDPDVADAVGTLLRRKAKLQDLKDRAAVTAGDAAAAEAEAQAAAS